MINNLELFFIAVGIFGFLAVIFSLFFAYGDRTKYITAEEIYPPNSKEFLTALSRLSNSPVEKNGEIKILKNGDKFFPRLL